MYSSFLSNLCSSENGANYIPRNVVFCVNMYSMDSQSSAECKKRKRLRLSRSITKLHLGEHTDNFGSFTNYVNHFSGCNKL